MLYGLYLSTAGAKAQNWRTDIIANNIANASTTGFRQQFDVVRERPIHEQPVGPPPPLWPPDYQNIQGGTHMYEVPDDLDTQGTIKTTGRMLDMAIQGEGFFQVQRGSDRLLTRNGSFALDEQGFLTIDNGNGQVMSATGGPIRLDANTPFAVSSDGGVIQNDAVVARLALSEPQQPESMTRVGDSLFSYSGGLAPASGSVKQGLLEGSNVNPINEMTELISASRAFELNINMIQLQNDSLSNLLQTVLRVS